MGYSYNLFGSSRYMGAANTLLQFDGAGFLYAVNDGNHFSGSFGSSPPTSQYVFPRDPAGRLTAINRLNAAAPNGYMSQFFSYDTADNLTQSIDANGNATTYAYDDFFRLLKETSPVTHTTTRTYDASGNVLSVTNANGATTRNTYDLLDRKTQSVSTGTVNGSPVTETVIYGYDAPSSAYGIGRLTSMSDPTGSTAFSYERRGLLAQEAQTMSGAPYKQTYTYDANGNRSTITYPSGSIVSYGYDFADRPISVVQTSAGLAARTGSSLMRHSTTYMRGFSNGSNANGAVRSASEISSGEPNAQATPFSLRSPWEAARAGGGMVSGIPVAPGVVRPIVQPPAVFEPSGGVSDASGAAQASQPRVPQRVLSSVTPSSTVYVANASYMPFGPLSGISFGNGTVQTISYDGLYQPLENKITASGGAVLADYKYTVDKASNVTGITDVTDSGYSRTFGYDDANRLITANAGSKLWGTASGNGYVYDNADNMTAIQLGARIASFAYRAGASGALPLLKSATENGVVRQITHDAAGNEKTVGSASYAYSPRNLLSSGDGMTYEYDGLGRRVATGTASGNRITVFGQDQEVLSESALTTGSTPPSGYYDYVWFAGRPIAQVDATGTHWTFGDHLGTPNLQTDINGNVSWRAEYEPFGKVWALRAGDVHQPLRFPGQTAEQFDTGANGATERSYNNARWYRAGWGRYTQADPIGLKGGLDVFAYASQNPVILTDRSGLDPISGAAGAEAGSFLGPAGAIAGYVGGSILGGIVLKQAGDAAGRIYQHFAKPKSISNPWTGAPGSETTCKGQDGLPKQTRRYGPDGFPETDTDWDHDHGQGQPHVHDWGRPPTGDPTTNDRGPGRAPRSGDPGIP